MTQHLTEEQLSGYIHQTLTDAEREAMDQHLTVCPTCRTDLNGSDNLQRRIRNELSADLRNARHSAQMSFAAIAPQIKRQRRFTVFMKQSNQLLSSIVAIVILIAAGIGLFVLFRNIAQPEVAPQQPTTVAVESTQPATVPATGKPRPAETPTEALINNPAVGDADQALGALKWKVEIDGQVLGTPAIADGIVYFGSNTGYLYAVIVQTGQELWASDIGGAIQQDADLAIADGVLYAGSKDEHIYAVDSQTGQSVWDFNAGNLRNSVAVGDGGVYVGSTDLYAVDPQTGQELWQFDTGSLVRDTPTVADGVIYVETATGHLYAVEAQTGQELWQFDTEDDVRWGFLSEVANGVIYAGTESYLYAVDIDTSQELWRFEAAGQRPEASIDAEIVYVANTDGEVRALDSQTGQELWQSKVGGPLSSPLASDGIVYVPSDDHQLYVLDGQTGQLSWQFTAEDVMTTPIVSDGVAYFGDDAGNFYAVWAGKPTTDADDSAEKADGQPPAGPPGFVMEITGDANPFSGPVDVAVDQEGNLYVVDGFNQRIQKFNPDGQFLTMWGSEGEGDGQFSFVDFASDFADGAVAVDGQGNVYVADTNNTRIQKFDSNGQFLAKWGSRGVEDGQFVSPTGLAVDEQGNVYVVDLTRDDIQKFDSNGEFLAKWSSRGSGEGRLSGPTQVAVDDDGNIYVAEDDNRRVSKFDREGQFLATWGTRGREDGQFFSPASITVDGQGHIYVADNGIDRIQKFDDQGQFLTKWGDSGSDAGQFNMPRGMVVDGEGNVYVADYSNNRIQKFRQPGVAESQP